MTGYIGGDVLYALNEMHPEYEYTAMVRGSEKGTMVAAAYPKARLVYGNLENATLLEEESAKADIVIGTRYSQCSIDNKILKYKLRRYSGFFRPFRGRESHFQRIGCGAHRREAWVLAPSLRDWRSVLER